MSLRRGLIRWTGWLATVLGMIQWIPVVPFLFYSYLPQHDMDLRAVQLVLVSVLMSLILLLIGYMFRHPRSNWMIWLYIPLVVYVAAEVGRLILADWMGWGIEGDLLATIEGSTAGVQLISGWPIWLGFVLLLHFLPRFRSDESNRIKTERGRFNAIWLLITVAIVGVVMSLAGSPMAFLEPVAILAIVVTLPFVLLLSGMAPAELPAFFGGLIWIKFIPANRVGDYRYFSRRAGRFVVLMGALTSLIGLVVMLGNLENPDMLGPSMAVALLSLFYGLAMKLLLFDPYCSILRLIEEADADD